MCVVCESWVGSVCVRVRKWTDTQTVRQLFCQSICSYISQQAYGSDISCTDSDDNDTLTCVVNNNNCQQYI